MKTAMGSFWKTYRNGIRWLAIEPQDELFERLIYIGMVIVEISLLWHIGYEHSKSITITMVAYLFILYFFSWKKDCWENSILQSFYKEEYYRNSYLCLNILLVVVMGVYTRSFLVIPLVIAPFAGTLLMLILKEAIIEFLITVTKNPDYVYKNTVIYVLVFCVLNLIPVVLSVVLLPTFWAWKALIVGAYVFLAPLIVVGADSSMDSTQLFSVM